MRTVLKGVKKGSGRRFAASKFREAVNLGLSRIATLKEERSNNCSANLRAIQLFIPYGKPFIKPALRRCGDLIKNQNRLDAYIIIEGYLNLLLERIHLFGHGRDCPDELKEAASGVVFAATRCKEIRELEDIKSILTSHFGRQFIGQAVELHNNNAPQQRLGEKLSEMKPSPESKMNLLNAIASQKTQEPPLPNQEEMIGKKRSKRWSKRGSEMIENSTAIFGSEDSSNSTSSRKRKNKGVALNTNPYETNFEPSTSILQTTRKSKGLVGLSSNPIGTSFDSFSFAQTNVKKPSSPTHTTQNNKITPKPTGVSNLLSSKPKIQRNKVVPLYTSPTPTNFVPQTKQVPLTTRRYPTRSSSHKS
ncbi:uncharacterized protein LOC120076425 isoform X1 [Benincasa hispida]|uniref:uncharacterized protein LOC120076425 isoform X1 n=1 Tax=Benincasa hispida TaxID=102211 RepID=UPI0019015FFE|nr:uncharacterized protein LOC120076425 isoform X1 [Benincasa hispida]